MECVRFVSDRLRSSKELFLTLWVRNYRKDFFFPLNYDLQSRKSHDYHAPNSNPFSPQIQITHFNPKHLLCLEAFTGAPFPYQTKTKLLKLRVVNLALALPYLSVFTPQQCYVPHTPFTESDRPWTLRLAYLHLSAFSIPTHLSFEAQAKSAAPLARTPFSVHFWCYICPSPVGLCPILRILSSTRL